jgi:hypothetical protein
MLVVKRHFTTPMRKVVLEKTALCLAGLESETKSLTADDSSYSRRNEKVVSSSSR